jgi:hypothetical protein
MIIQGPRQRFSADRYARILSTSNPSDIVAAHSGVLSSVCPDLAFALVSAWKRRAPVAAARVANRRFDL